MPNHSAFGKRNRLRASNCWQVGREGDGQQFTLIASPRDTGRLLESLKRVTADCEMLRVRFKDC